MTEANKTLLKNRFKSFLWRAAGMLVALFLAWVAETVQLLHLSPFWITAIGLVIGEITKALNTTKLSTVSSSSTTVESA